MSDPQLVTLRDTLSEVVRLADAALTDLPKGGRTEELVQAIRHKSFVKVLELDHEIAVLARAPMYVCAECNGVTGNVACVDCHGTGIVS
jgi:hypothetical protein